MAVVMITRDRCASAMVSLGHLTELPEQPPIVVVDNGSTDDTVATVRALHPDVRLVTLGHNAGAAARTAGVRAAGTPYVAFADDDSWWQPGALATAADTFDRYDRLGLIAATILVGADLRLDPTCADMANSPLEPNGPMPGPPVLGFLACGAIVRTSAYLEVGGFPEHYGIGGEESPVAIDLAVAGWQLAYVDDITAIHCPAATGDRDRRHFFEMRNALYLAWQRRRLPYAWQHTTRVVRQAVSDPVARHALVDALRHGPEVLRDRRAVPHSIERQLALLHTGERRTAHDEGSQRQHVDG